MPGTQTERLGRRTQAVASMYGSEQKSGSRCQGRRTVRRCKMNKLDLIGKRFGKLTVVSLAEGTKNGYLCWLCKCDCGNEKIVTSQALRIGHTKSCGCLKEGRIEVLGMKFGKLSVLEQIPTGEGEDKLYRCRCECGREVFARRKELLLFSKRSCGCARRVKQTPAVETRS